MKANYWHKGEVLDYLATEDVKFGAVVTLGSRIGIAGSDIPANERGQIHVTGVFEMTKEGAEIAQGTAVYYDKENDCITATADGNIPAGYAAQNAKAADATVMVKLLG